MHTAVKKYIPKDQDDWLQQRSKSIGGSEIATIMGLNPFQTPYEFWLQKTGRTPRFEGNIYTKAGIHLEEAIARYWSEETGLSIIKSSEQDIIYIHPKYSFITGTPDRKYWIETKYGVQVDKGILECKAVQWDPDVNKDTLEGLPDSWFCQAQVYMGLTGCNKAYIAWLKRGLYLDYVEIAFDESFYNKSVEFAVQWYQNHIVNDKPPKAVNSSDIEKIFKSHKEYKSYEATEEIFNQWERAKELKKSISEAYNELNVITEDIKMKLRDAEAFKYNGDTLFTWRKANDSAKLDTDILKKRYPEIYQECLRKEPGIRRFLIK